MPNLDPARLAQLARSAQSGDAEALNDLLSLLHPRLYYAALKLTGNAADAEDLTQDACVKLLDGLPQLRDPMALLDWADTIAKNTCLNHLKRKQPQLFRDDQTAAAVLDNLPEEQTDAVPERYLDMAAKREIILGMIDALPQAQRLTVYLYYYSGHTVQEIAQLMEVSEGTVKSRLSAARTNLKLQVEEEERRGNKLYLIFPFLGRLLHEDAQSAQAPVLLPVSPDQIAACAQQCAAVAAASSAARAGAGNAATEKAAGQAVRETAKAGAATPAQKAAAEKAAGQAAKAAAAKGGSALGAKVIAGVVAVALLAGGAVLLPRLTRGGQGPAPSQEAASPGTGGEETLSPAPTATPEPSPEPSAEPSLSPTDFDPEAMIGQPLSALVDIAGEPTEQSGTNVRWSSDMDYDFSVTLADDGQTIRELFIIYGPPVLGLDFGAAGGDAQAALQALGSPAGVDTINTGGGQTSYSALNADATRLYQFDTMDGAVFMRSIHDVS